MLFSFDASSWLNFGRSVLRLAYAGFRNQIWTHFFQNAKDGGIGVMLRVLQHPGAVEVENI